MLVVVLFAGCEEQGGPAGQDAAADLTGVMEGGADLTTDRGGDARADAAPDARVDMAPDAKPDATPDAPVDIGADAPVDIGADAPVDKKVTPADTAPVEGGGDAAVADAGGGGATATIGPAGGKLTLTGVGSLTVPKGALSLGVTLTIKKVNAGGKGQGPWSWTTDMIQLLPAGQQFQSPVTLTLSYKPSLLPKGAQETEQELVLVKAGQVASLAGAPGLAVAEQDIHELEHAAVDTKARTLSVSITHFSNYVGAATGGGLTFATLTHKADALRVLRRSAGLASTKNSRASTTHIVVHHTHTKGTLRVELVKGWNAARAGNASAQFWVGRNGVVAQATADGALVGHAPPTNSASVGIEMLNSSSQNYPLAQRLAVRRLVGYLAGRYDIPLRGRWRTGWESVAGTRAVPPGFDYTQSPPAGSAFKAYDRVLGHREVDRHKWYVATTFPKGRDAAGKGKATDVQYTSSVAGRYRVDTNWSCSGKGTKWSGWYAAGAAYRRSFDATVRTCFEPKEITSLATQIKVTARTVLKKGSAWVNVGDPNEVTYSLNNPPTSLKEINTAGPAAKKAGQPQLVAARRRKDPGGQGKGAYEFPFAKMLTELDYETTGIIEASGGDSWLDGTPGTGGDVTFEAGSSFAGGHFDAAEKLYLNKTNPATDEATQSYILHVPAGSSKTLSAGKHDVIWLLVEGKLQLSGKTELRAAMGIYVAPGGQIVAHDPSKAKLDGYDLTLETLGEALIFGHINATGHDAKSGGAAKLDGGKGGAVVIRQLASGHTLAPTVVTRGGDCDNAVNLSAPAPAGAKGGAVIVRALGTGARLVLGGGPGATAPKLLESRLPPAPLTNVYTPKNLHPKSGDRPLLQYDAFTRGVCTSGGVGGTYHATGRAAGSEGGAGGKITVLATQVAANGVCLWAGAGLEEFRKRFYVPTSGAIPTWKSWTGGSGGSHKTGGLGPGGHGGKGGDAGDVTISGTFVPSLSSTSSHIVKGWNGHEPHKYPLFTWPKLGLAKRWQGTVPGAKAARFMLGVCAVGGSGGFPGGSAKSYPGKFGKKGQDGAVSGTP